jgi:glycosyltransferase involved in cell wall biosynthesis
MTSISIIVPVFNSEKYLEDCIKSILSQTFRDFELILINDGSADKSGELCEYFQSQDSRVKVIHQKNQGVSAARNAGLSISNGKYIGFVDSDDTIEFDMYESLYKCALEYEADISACRFRRINENERNQSSNSGEIKVYNKDEGLSAFLKQEISGSICDKIYKHELIKNKKFEGVLYEDLLFNFFAMKDANRIVFQNDFKYNYFVRSGSASNSKFSSKHLDTILFTKKILKVVQEEFPSHLEEAKNLDFIYNLSFLNLILLSNHKSYPKEYSIVLNNLNRYSNFIKNSKIVKLKHRIAYYLFQINPFLYLFTLRIYGLMFKSDAFKRT